MWGFLGSGWEEVAQTLGCSWMFEGGLGSQPLLRHFSAGEETSGSGVAMELGLQMTVFGWGPRMWLMTQSQLFPGVLFIWKIDISPWELSSQTPAAPGLIYSRDVTFCFPAPIG